MTHQLILDINETKNNRTNQNSSGNTISNYNLFRMYYDPSTKNLYVNFVNPIYQNWDSRTIKNLRKYFDNYTSGNATTSRQNNTERPSFLQRNKKRMLMVLGKKPKTYYIKNRITYKTGFNSIRLIPENPHTEDVIHRIRPKKTTENYVISTIIKVTKFRNWVDSQI